MLREENAQLKRGLIGQPAHRAPDNEAQLSLAVLGLVLGEPPTSPAASPQLVPAHTRQRTGQRRSSSCPFRPSSPRTSFAASPSTTISAPPSRRPRTRPASEAELGPPVAQRHARKPRSIAGTWFTERIRISWPDDKRITGRWDPVFGDGRSAWTTDALTLPLPSESGATPQGTPVGRVVFVIPTPDNTPTP